MGGFRRRSEPIAFVPLNYRWQFVGAGVPDVSGLYRENVVYGGEMSYIRSDGNMFIWRSGVDWIASSFLGGFVFPVMKHANQVSPLGIYLPFGGGSGTFTFLTI